MVFDSGDSGFELTVDNFTLRKIKSIACLRIESMHNLKWYCHIDNKVKGINRGNFVMSQISQTMKNKELFQVYYAL